jgi:hypothetical protein
MDRRFNTRAYSPSYDGSSKRILTDGIAIDIHRDHAVADLCSAAGLLDSGAAGNKSRSAGCASLRVSRLAASNQAQRNEQVVGALVVQCSRQTKKIFISPNRESPITQLRFLQSRRREFIHSHCGILRSCDVFLQPEHPGLHRFERR